MRTVCSMFRSANSKISPGFLGKRRLKKKYGAMLTRAIVAQEIIYELRHHWLTTVVAVRLFDVKPLLKGSL